MEDRKITLWAEDVLALGSVSDVDKLAWVNSLVKNVIDSLRGTDASCVHSVSPNCKLNGKKCLLLSGVEVCQFFDSGLPTSLTEVSHADPDAQLEASVSVESPVPAESAQVSDLHIPVLGGSRDGSRERKASIPTGKEVDVGDRKADLEQIEGSDGRYRLRYKAGLKSVSVHGLSSGSVSFPVVSSDESMPPKSKVKPDKSDNRKNVFRVG